jgi:hypothetical protein
MPKKNGGVILMLLIMTVMIAISGVQIKMPSPSTRGKIVVSWQTVEASGRNDYLWSNYADAQTALNSLPSSGGSLQFLGGDYDFGGHTVVRNIDNVQIIGIGNSTYFHNGGISAGSQSGWTFSSLRTGVTGITYSSATNVTLISVNLNGISIGTPTSNISASTGRAATYVIAASNSTETEKAEADAVCTGKDDDVLIQKYFNALMTNTTGTLVLLSGTYNGTTGITESVNDQTWRTVIINAYGAIYNYTGTGDAIHLSETMKAYTDTGGVGVVTSNNTRITINGLTINGSNVGQSGLHLSDYNNFRSEDLTINGFNKISTGGVSKPYMGGKGLWLDVPLNRWDENNIFIRLEMRNNLCNIANVNAASDGYSGKDLDSCYFQNLFIWLDANNSYGLYMTGIYGSQPCVFEESTIWFTGLSCTGIYLDNGSDYLSYYFNGLKIDGSENINGRGVVAGPNYNDGALFIDAICHLIVRNAGEPYIANGTSGKIASSPTTLDVDHINTVDSQTNNIITVTHSGDLNVTLPATYYGVAKGTILKGGTDVQLPAGATTTITATTTGNINVILVSNYGWDESSGKLIDLRSDGRTGKENAGLIDFSTFNPDQLIDNGSFEYGGQNWTANAHCNFTIVTPTVGVDPPIAVSGTKVAKLVSAGTYAFISQSVSDYSKYAGKTVTVLAHYYIPKTSGATIAAIQLYDGQTYAGNTRYLSKTYSALGCWGIVTTTRMIGLSPTQMTVSLYVNNSGAANIGDIIYYDGIMVTEGNTGVDYAPNPYTDTTFLTKALQSCNVVNITPQMTTEQKTGTGATITDSSIKSHTGGARSTAGRYVIMSGMDIGTNTTGYINWAKPVYILATFAASPGTDKTVISRIQLKAASATGELGANGLGFTIGNGANQLEIYGTSYGASGLGKVDLGSITDKSVNQLLIAFDPVTHMCTWYLNGVQKGTSQTTAVNLPAGESSSSVYFVVSTENGSSGGDEYFTVCNMWVFTGK